MSGLAAGAAGFRTIGTGSQGPLGAIIAGLVFASARDRRRNELLVVVPTLWSLWSARDQAATQSYIHTRSARTERPRIARP